MVLTLGMTALTGCGGEKETAENALEAGGEEAKVVASPGSKGSLAPDFTLKRIAGGELQLASLRGKVVLLDFWDTWCPPCKKALPHLQELSEIYRDDLVVVGVAMGREGEGKVRSYIEKHGLTFEMVLFNNDMKLLSDFGGMRSIPTTFLIDGEGVIQKVWVGAFGKAEYERAVKAVIES